MELEAREHVPELLITLDVGGSSAKASVLSLDDYELVAHAASQYVGGRPQAPDYDLTQLRAAALRVLHDAVKKAGYPSSAYAGVTVTSMRGPFVVADADLAMVLPCIKNTDRRASVQARRLQDVVGAEELYRTTGHWAAPEWGLPKLMWLRDEYPEAWTSVRWILQLHDWIVYQLSGSVASEPSSAAMSQLLDVRGVQWATDLLETFGFDARHLPELRPASTRVGQITHAVATQIGLQAGIPVYLGGGDTHITAAGASVGCPDLPVVVAGTTAPVLVAVRSFGQRSNDSYPALVSPHLWPGVYAFESNAGASGTVVSAMAGLKDPGGPLATQLAEANIRAAVAQDAGVVADPTVFAGNPFFSPEGWEVTPTVTIAGLRPEHTMADLFAASLRASCFAIRRNVELLQRLTSAQWDRIVVSGGMTGWPHWNQLLADICGREIQVEDPDLAMGRGGAAAVLGETALDDRQHHGHVVYRPNGDGIDPYHEQLLAYELHYQAARDLARDLA